MVEMKLDFIVLNFKQFQEKWKYTRLFSDQWNSEEVE
jgi:hypothetical protein